MRFYENLPNAQKFDEYYKIKPHLLKVHQKAFKDTLVKDKHFEYANNYQPKDLDNWVKSFGKLYEYEKYALCKVDRDEKLVILSYYSIGENNLYLRGRVIIDDNVFYEYVNQQWKLTQLSFLFSPRRAMGYDTDAFMYLQQQSKLDSNSLEVLKSLPQFKYLPIEKFWKINVLKLFDINDNAIYQYELMLKAGYTRLVSDMLVNRKMFSKKEILDVKHLLKPSVRLRVIETALDTMYRQRQEKIKKLKEKQAIAKFNKLKKVKLELGKFIVKTPSDASELKQEGLQLKHCVYNYLNQIVNKETQVLLLRKASDPDTPFYTIEIKNKEVMQVRGLNNKTEKKYIKLVNSWYEKGLLKDLINER